MQQTNPLKMIKLLKGDCVFEEYAMYEELDRYKDILYSSGLFDEIDFSLIPALFRSLNAQIIRYGQGELMLAPGDRIQRMGIVLDGTAAVAFLNADGREDIFYTLTPGMTYGTMYALIDCSRCRYHVYADRPTVILSLELLKLLKSGKAQKVESVFGRNLLLEMATRCTELYRRLEIFSQKRIRSRLKIFLMDQQHENGVADLYISRTELAAYLGVDRTALARELTSMQNDGLIRLRKQRIELLDREFFQLDGQVPENH